MRTAVVSFVAMSDLIYQRDACMTQGVSAIALLPIMLGRRLGRMSLSVLCVVMEIASEWCCNRYVVVVTLLGMDMLCTCTNPTHGKGGITAGSG